MNEEPNGEGTVPAEPGQDGTPRDALDWMLLRAEGPVSSGQDEAFRAWLAQSPDHARDYADLERTYGMIDPRAAAAPAPTTSRRRGLAGAIAAAVALLLAVSVLVAPWFDGTTYRTAVGEQRSITLEDGSVAHLSGDTVLRVRFDDSTRDVTLRDGEVLFEVAKDAARPFRVTAGARIVQAVGTVFDVDRRGETVDVAVGEGAVAILTPSEDAAPRVQDGALRLAAGQAATYDGGHGGVRTRPVEIAQVGAWRRSIFFFEDETLEKIVATLARQYPGRFVVADARLASRRYSGSITLRDRAQTLRQIERSLSVQIRDAGGDRFEFSATPPAQSSGSR